MNQENTISPSAFVHPEAKIGTGNIIYHGVTIGKNVEIGDSNVIYPYAVIGTDPEHKSFFGKETKGVKIGVGNVIREFVTINSGTFQDTLIGSNCWLLRGSHVGHDSVIEDLVTLSCNVLIGGESQVCEGANLGLGAAVHQRSIIGHYSMIGMNSVVPKTREVLPLMKYAGSPIEHIGKNTHWLEKLDEATIQRILNEYEGLRK